MSADGSGHNVLRFCIVFAVYGTVILYRNTVTPTCWGHDRRKREALVHTMVWTTWGQAIFLL